MYNTDIVVKKIDLSFLGNVKLKEIDIKDHHKLHGKDVILAHRLLKNSI